MNHQIKVRDKLTSLVDANLKAVPTSTVQNGLIHFRLTGGFKGDHHTIVVDERDRGF